MINRRDFLLASLAAAMSPAMLHAHSAAQGLSWKDFQSGMQGLSAGFSDRSLSDTDIGVQGMQLMKNLDIGDPEFPAAIENAYESGNRFWFWQRLARESGLLGGVLTVEQGSDVPLHDHPGATGMLRVLTGELELWQFDVPQKSKPGRQAHVDLQRVAHRILHAGDSALLSPHRGNIHALRARSRECSMLDYFVPPYDRRVRTWYKPTAPGWREMQKIACRSIGESDYYAS